jgi:hypothetical protein
MITCVRNPGNVLLKNNIGLLHAVYHNENEAAQIMILRKRSIPCES